MNKKKAKDMLKSISIVERLHFDAHNRFSTILTFQNHNPDIETVHTIRLESVYVLSDKLFEFLDTLCEEKGMKYAVSYTYSNETETEMAIIIEGQDDIKSVLFMTRHNNDTSPSAVIVAATEGREDQNEILKEINDEYYTSYYPGDDDAFTDFNLVTNSAENDFAVAFIEFMSNKAGLIRDIEPETQPDKIFIITPTQGGLALRRYTIDGTGYDESIIDSNYNDDFKAAYDKLTGFLQEPNKPGLVLFTGEPGTGKTSIIHHLANKADVLDKRFVLLPSAFVGILSDPGFTEFAADTLGDCVLCIEDAEIILRSRDTGPNDAVTNILNVTDGILGNITNLKVICTVNNDTNLDSALMRKGRLKLKYKFEPLDTDKANALAKKLEKDVKFDGPTTLADIYNADEQIEFNTVSKGKIGF